MVWPGIGAVSSVRRQRGRPGLPTVAGVAATSPASPTPTGTGATAGVASQYGAVSLAVFVGLAIGILYLVWRRGR